MVDRGISFGGSLVVIARLAKSLDRERYEPIVVSAMDWVTIRHHIPNNIKVYRVAEPYDYVMWAKTVQVLKKIKPRVLFKAVLYSLSLVQLLANSLYFFKVSAVILREKIDLLHDNNSISAAAAGKLMLRPVVWHMHGQSEQDSSVLNISKHIFRRMDRYISISQFITELAVKDGIAADRIETLHNPIEKQSELLTKSERILLKQHYKLAPDKLVVSIFGRLVSWKGQLELLKAIRLLDLEKIPLQLMIVGDDGEGYGDYIAELKRYVEKNDLQESVFFTGYVMEVAPLYQISDIVVHASIEPEPFGLVITEAAQNNCAVICSSHGAGPELVDDGYDGFVVDPMDTESLAAKLKILIQDPEQREIIAARGAERALKNLSPETYARSVEAVYDKVLAQPNAYAL